MANTMVGCRAGAGTDINLFALVHDLDFRDRSWGEAASQQVVWLWVPSHPLCSFGCCCQARLLDRGALPCSPVAASVFPGSVRHSARQELTVCNA